MGAELPDFRTSFVSLCLCLPVLTLYILFLPRRIKQAMNDYFLSFKLTKIKKKNPYSGRARVW